MVEIKKITCKYCNKDFIGYSDKHVQQMEAVHIVSKHREMLTEAIARKEVLTQNRYDKIVEGLKDGKK